MPGGTWPAAGASKTSRPTVFAGVGAAVAPGADGIPTLASRT